MPRSSALKKISRENEFPAGTVLGEWFLAREAGTWCIKRMVTYPDGTRSAKRAPIAEYRKYIEAYTDREKEEQAKLPGSDLKAPRALEDFVIRLNGKDPKAERLKEQVRYTHAWINDEFLQAYKRDELYSSISDRTNADALFAYLNRYALHWLINIKKLHSPLQWKEAEKEWGRYLMNRKEDQKELLSELRIFRDSDPDDKLRTPKTRKLSAKVLRYTLFEINRFVRYIYKKRRSEFENELIQLEPWGDDLLKTYEAEWRSENPARPTKYIKPEHWTLIEAKMLEQKLIWRHQVHLAHDYGLRRRETMGLNEFSVRPNYLHLLQQLKKFETRGETQDRLFGPLKGREAERKVPHWFEEPKVTRARIRAMLGAKMPHPDTVSDGFIKLCLNLKDEKGLPLPNYIFHDLRRTFITNAVKKGIPVEELRQTTGHKDPQVLIKFYLMDARELEADYDLGEDDDDIVV
jgi:hypothetical protein